MITALYAFLASLAAVLVVHSVWHSVLSYKRLLARLDALQNLVEIQRDGLDAILAIHMESLLATDKEQEKE